MVQNEIGKLRLAVGAIFKAVALYAVVSKNAALGREHVIQHLTCQNGIVRGAVGGDGQRILFVELGANGTVEQLLILGEQRLGHGTQFKARRFGILDVGFDGCHVLVEHTALVLVHGVLRRLDKAVAVGQEVLLHIALFPPLVELLVIVLHVVVDGVVNDLTVLHQHAGFITLGGTKQTQYYNMGYDSFGNMTSISVGSQELASYDYGPRNGKLRSMTYGNTDTVSYSYDILGRVTEERWKDKLKYQYVYSSDGYLAKKLDVTTGKAVNYEYDSLGRLIHSYQIDNGTIQQRTEHLYDSENRLTSQSWQLGDTRYKESYKYNANDGSLTSVNLDGMVGYAYLYDSLKRLNAQYNWLYGRFYTYRTNNGNQTTQIASINYTKRDGGTGFNEFSLGYEYDAGGNITKVTHSTNTAHNASYTYDSQNQLTKEVNTNGTYNYTYDTYGNIRSVSGAESHTYTYGDSEWLDLLTAYDGKSITYDAIGNPAVWHNSSGDWELSWSNGRQLTEAKKGSHFISYTYDLAGIRDSKTVDGVTYNYITQNGQVVRQTWGDHVMDFIYDNSGKPYALKYDGTTYYYVLNLQGDVISIITHWGESYGSYTYDAWGNVLSVSGDIANLNPIRYRGYYYDSETRLYYLGSRYYDPQVKRFINADGAAFATINPYSNGLTDKNYFAYCDNDPVSRSDDGGEFWNIVVGAVVGGIGGALSAAASGGNIALGAAQGAASGAITALIPNKIVAKTLVSAGMAFFGSVSQQLSSSGKINIASTVSDTLWGAASGALGAKVGGVLDSSVGKSYSVIHAAADVFSGVASTTYNISSQAIISGLQRRNSNSRRQKNNTTAQRKRTIVSRRYRYARKVGCRTY